MQVLATATKTKGIKRNSFTAAERIRQRTLKVGLEEGDVHVQLLIIFMKGTEVREKSKSRTCLCCGAGFPYGQPFSNSSHSKIPYEKMSHCVGKKKYSCQQTWGVIDSQTSNSSGARYSGVNTIPFRKLLSFILLKPKSRMMGTKSEFN